jgi:signal transduction histidine kinase
VAQWRALVDVPGNVRGPAAGRHVTAALLPAWGLAHLVESAKLVVSDLITNAYQHSPQTDSFELELSRRGDGVRIAVVDGSAIRPVVRELSRDGTTGCGMVIVQALASRWGADEHAGGKRVWVDLDQPASGIDDAAGD